MADIRKRLSENVEGDFFVDSTCIDCETCMFVAPSVFAESERELSFVHHQPVSPEDRHRALMALVSCPTSSIGTRSGISAGKAARSYPESVAPGSEVFYCGYAHENSFGASSYLIRRPAGNVLVDSPRAAEPLLRNIENLGGVRWMFLTHKDDVADHREFHQRFGCERILHQDERTPDTSGLERFLEGTDPIPLAEDLLVIPVPGHTRGSCALLFRETYLFTGDHLWGDGEGRLGASRRVAWDSWEDQIKSMERLAGYSFEWVLPGHGRPWRAASNDDRNQQLGELITRMRDKKTDT